MKYCIKGVGGDVSCNLQVALDGRFLLSTDSDFVRHLPEFPFNTLRVSILYMSSVSEILAAVKNGRMLGLVPIISCCTPTNIAASVEPDDFAADLAVGCGATQIHVDGIYLAESCAQLNRLHDIATENLKIPFIAKKFHVI